MAANAYYNFLENRAGLGKNGTHLVHAGAAGGATWAAGKYGGVEMIQDNWYAPFVGGLAGLGMSVTVRYLLLGGSEEKSVDLALEKIEQDLKGRKMTSAQRMRLAKIVVEIRKVKGQDDDGEDDGIDDLIEVLAGGR